MVEREPVISTNIASIGYEPDTETLEVEFKTSGIYHYFNVPPFMHERLMTADSVGTFFNAEIKKAYPCQKL
jgi:hypothetical protein